MTITRLITTMRDAFSHDTNDQRPRILRTILPMSYATAPPLSNEQRARILFHAYH